MKKCHDPFLPEAHSKIITIKRQCMLLKFNVHMNGFYLIQMDSFYVHTSMDSILLYNIL